MNPTGYFLILILLAFRVSAMFSAPKQTLLVFEPRLVETTPQSPHYAAVTNAWQILTLSLRTGAASSDFTVADLKIPAPATGGIPAEIESVKKNGADFGLSTRIFLFENRLIVGARLTEVSARTVRFEDQVYTYNLSNTAGLSNALAALADRIAAHRKGETVGVYAGERPPGENVEIDTNNGELVLPVKKTERLQKLTVAGLSYAFPTGFELEFLSGFYCWLHPELRFGIGAGTGLARIFLNYPGVTNMTGTILPLQLHVPLWTHPDANRVLDFLFTAEWAWFSPLQITGTSTNTNANSFFDQPIRYLDFRVTGYFFRFASASLGLQWIYESSLPQLYFYGGVSVFLGFYQKE